MNARQKAKLYKKQRDRLYQALLNSVYENHKIGEEIRRGIIDIGAEERCGKEWEKALEKHENVVIEGLIKDMTSSELFKQSVAIEKYRDPITGEIVYRAHLQTIRPTMEEE